MRQNFKCDKCDHFISDDFERKFDKYPFNKGYGKSICPECKEGTLLYIDEYTAVDNNYKNSKHYDDKSYNKLKYMPQDYIETRKKIMNKPKLEDFL